MHNLHRRLSPSTFRKRRTVVALALGFTAIPAVALAATDAVPGDPFKLGQENKIANATTTLTGIDSANNTLKGVLQLRRESGAGSVLKVENTAQGTIGGAGIDIRVAPGKRPITVNADAGKASNLNADRLDGRDEEDFLPTRLYGSSSGLVDNAGGGETVLLALKCDEGDIALNAGGNAIGIEDDLNSIEPFRSSYTIEFQDNLPRSKFRANIICMDNARPFR